MEKISSPRKRRKRSLGLGQHLKGACPNVRTESKYPGNKKRNHKWVQHQFLKINKSSEQFLLKLTLFLPYLRLTVKIFQFLQLSTKFLAVLRLSVNPIETLCIVWSGLNISVSLR